MPNLKIEDSNSKIITYYIERFELQNFKIKPDYKDNVDLSENLKNLNKQLNRIKIENIKKDKNKNIIKDKKVGSIIIREQILKDFPPKELRSIIDQGKKDIKSGVIISISISLTDFKKCIIRINCLDISLF